MKLKTLEDLPIPEWVKKLLRREAIKWVKCLRHNQWVYEMDKIIKLRRISSKYHKCDEEGIKWIKHFFNITEEALK